MKKSIYAIFAAAALSCSAADETNTGAATSATIPSETETPSQELAPFEVSAMRFGESLYDVPVSAQNISAKQIAESGEVSVPEVLRKDGNIYFRNSDANPFQGDISMRGFGENSGQRVLVLLDGQRINRLDMAPVAWSQLPLETIDNIEIIRGSQTALYGNYAIGGVIKISTKKWNQPDMASAGGFFGTYGEYGAWGRASHSTEDYYASLDANYYHNSGYRDDSLNWMKSVGLSAGAKLDSKNELNLHASIGDEYVENPLPFATREDMMKDPTYSAGKSFENNNNYANVTLGWENNSDIGTGSAQLGMIMREKQVENVAYFSSQQNHLWTLSFTPRYKFNVGESHYIEAGVDTYYDNMSHTNYGMPHYKSSTGHADIDRETVAPWVAGKYQINDMFSVNLGARYEAAFNSVDYNDKASAANSYDDSQTMHGYSGQFGLNAKIDETWNVYFRFDQIYRYPTIDESASYWGYGTDFYNKDLKPERGQNYEIGANFARDAWSVNVSAFYMHLEDEIQYAEVSPYVFKNQNIGETDRLGAEVRIAYELENFGASTSWAFVSAQYANGKNKDNDVPLVPNIVSYTQVWVKPVSFVRLSAGYQWCSEQYMGGDDANAYGKMPAYWTVDLTANVYISKHARLFVSVNNVTDEIYANYAFGSAYGQSWYPSIGRTVRAGVEFKF